MRKNNNKNQEVGRITVAFRPYEKDLKQIDILTKNDFGNNQSDTLRDLVREALERRRLVGSAKDATMSIVRKEQRSVISDELTPLTKQLDSMANEIKLLKDTQANLSSGIAKSTAQLTGEFHASREGASESGNKNNNQEILSSIQGMLRQVMQSLVPLTTNNETALKNVIALRGLFYFFLMAYQTDDIKEGDKLNRNEWVYFVRAVSKRIGGLAVDEYKNLDADGQNEFIQDYAKKLFETVRFARQSDIQKITR